MNKTIKSGVREMLFRMIAKFEEKQQEKEALFNQKQDCLRVVLDFIKNLKNVIKESFESITPQEWKKITDHIIHIENKYKERDRILEDNLKTFIINVGDSDSSGSNESFHMEMLDSDFDYDSE